MGTAAAPLSEWGAPDPRDIFDPVSARPSQRAVDLFETGELFLLLRHNYENRLASLIKVMIGDLILLMMLLKSIIQH